MSNIIQSSLIQFSISNFKCFKDRVDFSMVTRKDSQNHFKIEKTGDFLLKTSIIFGPNASGKSSLLEGVDFMKKKILSSTDNEHIDKLVFSEFLMEDGYHEQPTFFELIFVLGKSIYRYNFSILRNHSIVHENLYKVNAKSEKELFSRKFQKITINDDFTKDKILSDRTKDTALFLSVADKWNVKIAEDIIQFFYAGIAVIQGHGVHKFSNYTRLKVTDENYKSTILKYLIKADFSMKNLRILEKEVEIPDKFKEIIGDKQINNKKRKIIFTHNKFDIEGKIIGDIEIDDESQSTGTMNFFNELGPIIDTLEKGKILLIDELDASLHPDLCDLIVELFHSKEINLHNAQLIFTSHNYRLLENKNIHRDEFWFTERNKYGSSKLFALAEFKERNSSDFYKQYFDGRIGARPFIDNNFSN